MQLIPDRRQMLEVGVAAVVVFVLRLIAGGWPVRSRLGQVAVAFAQGFRPYAWLFGQDFATSFRDAIDPEFGGWQALGLLLGVPLSVAIGVMLCFFTFGTLRAIWICSANPDELSFWEVFDQWPPKAPVQKAEKPKRRAKSKP